MRTFCYERIVQWGECDPAGIIYFPNYLRWMADGLNAFLIDVGLDPLKRLDGDVATGLPCVSCSLEFLQPAKPHDLLQHELVIARVGDKSVDIDHRFLRGETCLARGRERRVWAEMRITDPKLDPVPVPIEIRTLFCAD